MLTTRPARSLRVLQVLPTLQRRGIEKIVCAITLELHGHGYHVDVCCQKTKGPLETALREHGVRVFCLEEKGPRDPAAAWRLLSILRSGKYDVLHSHSPEAAGYQLPVAWLGRVPRIICTFHSAPGLPAPPGASAKSGIRKLCAMIASHHVDWIYACSDAVLKGHRTTGWGSRHSSVIYNGVDLARLRPAPDKAAAKEAFGIRADSAVIGSVGSLCEQKGQSHLIRSLPLIRRRVPEACLLIVGSGPDSTALSDLARELGCANAVQFLGERDQIAECLHAMDVFALPSTDEGFGLAIVEAMACGVPVVASSAGGVPEVIVDGVSGLLVPPADQAAIAGAVLRILDSGDLAKTLAAEAARVVQEKFAITKVANEVGDLYRRLVHDQRHAARERCNRWTAVAP